MRWILLFLLGLSLEISFGIWIDATADSSSFELEGGIPKIIIRSGEGIQVNVDWNGNEPDACKFPSVNGNPSYFSQNGNQVIGSFPSVSQLISCGLTRHIVPSGEPNELSLQDYIVYSNLLSITRKNSGGNIYKVMRTIQLGFPKIIVVSNDLNIVEEILRDSVISDIDFVHDLDQWEVEITFVVRFPYQITQQTFSSVRIPIDPQQRSINFLSLSEPSSPDQNGDVRQILTFSIPSCGAWELPKDFSLLNITTECRPGSSSCSGSVTPSNIRISIQTADACPINTNYDVGTVTMEFFNWRNEQKMESVALNMTSDFVFVQADFSIVSAVSPTITVQKICALSNKSDDCGEGQISFRSNTGNNRINLPTNFNSKAAAVISVADIKVKVPQTNQIWIRMELMLAYPNTLGGNKRSIKSKVLIGRLDIEESTNLGEEDSSLASRASLLYILPIICLMFV